MTITGTGFTGASNVAFGSANIAEGGYIVVDRRDHYDHYPSGGSRFGERHGYNGNRRQCSKHPFHLTFIACAGMLLDAGERPGSADRVR